MKDNNIVSGVWACSLNNYKPFLPQKQKRKQQDTTEFQNLLDAEIKRLKEKKK